MHSYKELDPEIRKTLAEQAAAREAEAYRAREARLAAANYQPPQSPETLGPTGRFPDGKLTEADEGETRFQIGVVKGKVVLNFGGPTHALGFTPEQAIGLADLLRKHAKSLLPKKNHNGKNRMGRK
jgi:hypothetical protein